MWIITVSTGLSSQPVNHQAGLTIPTPPSQPIQTLYQSARILPQLPNNAPSTLQPFLGFSSLALPVTTQQANQARLSSAAITIPCQQQLPHRGVRHQPAIQSQWSATRLSEVRSWTWRTPNVQVQVQLVSGPDLDRTLLWIVLKNPFKTSQRTYFLENYSQRYGQNNKNCWK